MRDALYISGHEISSEIKTPHIIYSEVDLLRGCSLIREGFPNAAAYFAVKSCYAPPVLSALAHAGFGAEVMSAFEYNLARKNGFSAEKIILNGLGRSAELLELACREGSTIVIDSAGDLQRIKKIAHSGIKVKLGIRLRIDGLDAFKTPYGNVRNKLGVDKSDHIFKDFLKLILAMENVEFKLLHTHFTINEKNSAIYIHALQEIRKTFDDLLSSYPSLALPKNISVGGGFYPFGEEEGDAARSLFVEISDHFKLLFPDNTLCVEPGRFLTNPAGYVVTRVIDTKTASGLHHVLVDAGTNVLIPIPSVHYAMQDVADGANVFFSLADGITSPDNVIVKEARALTLPDEGEIIVLKNCGAYTDVLSEFWVYMPYSGSFLSAEGRLIPYRSLDNLRVACENMWGI